MASAFVIRNQLGQYLTRKDEWVSGKDASIVFYKTYYDEALNQLFEINTKDIELRGKVFEVELGENKKPVLAELGPEPEQPETVVTLPEMATAESAPVGVAESAATPEREVSVA